ncbi:MAG: hypothetical protein HRT51_09540 [Colwellia sp.]|nr:hypothetical protein [Colwellia sp.]
MIPHQVPVNINKSQRLNKYISAGRSRVYTYLNYSATDDRMLLTGLSFRVHFNAAALEYVATSNIFSTNFIADTGVQSDSNDADNFNVVIFCKTGFGKDINPS